MPTSHTELTALPVVVPLAAVALAVLLRRLHRRGSLTVLRALVAVVLVGYGAGVLANTLFPITLAAAGPRPPWSLFLNLTPLAGTEPRDMAENVLVFLPLGVLLPLVARLRSWWRVLLVGLLLSLAMELVQLVNALVGHGGHIADVNDLLANTVGAPLGYAVLRAALLLPPLRRLAAAATWPAPAQPTAVGDGGALPPRGASPVISSTIAARSAADGSPQSGA
ncbi:VanZ family protein [Modestobacter sp. NPDC049651]|uniref:VanZ family protein n=1 Tax=unclassified Modestobacter TaxID=2643866 RepID=UPI0033FD42BE